MTYFLNKCLKILLSSLQKLDGVGGERASHLQHVHTEILTFKKFAYSIAAFFILFSQNKLQLHVEELREGGREQKNRKQKTRRWQFIKPGLENGCPMSCPFYGLWSDPGIKQVSEGNLLFPLPYGWNYKVL